MKLDCAGYKDGLNRCTILTENLCETCGGKCAFYITRENARKNRETAEKSLHDRGLRPCIKMKRSADGSLYPIQSVTFI